MYSVYILDMFWCYIVIFFFSSRRRHTRCALVTGVQTCALPVSEMRDWLIKDRVDLALLYEPPPSVLMVCETIYREELVLAYPRALRPAPPRKVKVADLARYPLVLPSVPNTIRALVDSTCRDLNVELNVVAEVDVVHSIVETTARGNMFTIIPRSAITDHAGQDELGHSQIIEPTIRNNLTLALSPDGAGFKRIGRASCRERVCQYV